MKSSVGAELMNEVDGTVQGHRDGHGFVVRAGADAPDVYISPQEMRAVLHRDRRDVAMDRLALGVPALVFALGMYLPLELNLPALVGGVLAHSLGRRADAAEGGRGRIMRERGVIIASGFMAGGALGGVLGADAVNLFEDFVLFHNLRFHQFGGSANIRGSQPEGCTSPLDAGADVVIVNVPAVPSQQVFNPVDRGNGILPAGHCIHPGH